MISNKNLNLRRKAHCAPEQLMLIYGPSGRINCNGSRPALMRPADMRPGAAPERIQEAVDKAHSDFNLRKAED